MHLSVEIKRLQGGHRPAEHLPLVCIGPGGVAVWACAQPTPKGRLGAGP